MQKSLIHFGFLGLVFLLVEYIFRCLFYDSNYFHPALLLMFFVGGLCSLSIGQLNEIGWVNKNINIFWQSFIGMWMILIIEFFSGVSLNLILKLDIWSYSKIPGNLMGQICIPFAFIWFCLCPFGFWLDDTIRWYLWANKSKYLTVYRRPYGLLEIYSRFWNPMDKPFI